MPSTLITPAKDLPTTKDLRHHRAHALVGLYVVLHFGYRYVMFFIDMDSDMGFTYHDVNRSTEKSQSPNRVMFLLFFPHFLAQMSGFGFKIPETRHPDGNRIWPQYRFEAVIFFFRSVALLFLAWWNKQKSIPLDKIYRPQAMSFSIVLVTMIAADIVAKRFHALGMASRTIRGLKAPRSVQYLMSAAQFHATFHSLLTGNRLSVQIAALSVVQLSAFGMTLRRKGIITQAQGVLLYAMILLQGMTVIVHDLISCRILYFAITLGNVAVLLRFEFGWNKYILWCTIAAIVRYMHAFEPQLIEDENMGKNWLLASIGSTMILLVGAMKQQISGNNPEQKLK